MRAGRAVGAVVVVAAVGVIVAKAEFWTSLETYRLTGDPRVLSGMWDRLIGRRHVAGGTVTGG